MALEKLYQTLTSRLDPPQGNPCGECRACCTARGLDRQRVSDLEFDYIRHKVGPDKVEAFRDYAARELARDGQLKHDLCPYYDEELQGCEIHPHRPYSCRIFGHYRLESTRLPQGCTFVGREKVVSPRRHYREIPLASEIRDMARRYWPDKSARPIRHVNAANLLAGNSSTLPRELLSDQDPVDRAFLAEARQQATLALQSLEQALESEQARPYVLFHKARVLTDLGEHGQAQSALKEALKLAPHSWDLHYHLALSRFESGDYQAAFRSFVRTVERNPVHALAWGFLGYMTLSDELVEQAALFFENALAVDTDNPTFHLRLGTCYLLLDRAEAALPRFQSALALDGPEEITAEARRYLEQLERPD